MAPKARFRVRWIQGKKEHVKYANLSVKGERRYDLAVHRFFNWCDLNQFSMPTTFPELDYVGGEYIDYLYQNDHPVHWGGDLLSGLKRLCSGSSTQLPTVCKYFDNWSKGVLVKRAIPLSPELLQGMVCYLFVVNEPRLALGFLLGFLGLLRIEEILGIKCKQIVITRSGWAILSFPDSKGSKLKGEPETVIVKDRLAVQALSKILSQSDPDEFLVGQTYRRATLFYKQSAAHFGLIDSRVTSHGLRRGGATWHFCTHGSYDCTASHGRWASIKSARTYIDRAVAELTLSKLPKWGVRRLDNAVPLLEQFLRTSF